jgi:hypothetical protein
LNLESQFSLLLQMAYYSLNLTGKCGNL